ncbi:uncharacterized protein HMPREF1541_10151 [Cyphellophora europaea CBS 101466]|uniref:Uncharacterized protein n=1 Tax=Cyphellophora europaea (strain CBS 101466) TaxID=1220924 RepID=W2S6Z9_CYPE1|nr:uncharacterized protein HMPREF1541_10151 [Cyphellophora europaea CBS 101466]ETN44481.1 hypothetical protein HMPREF1541_10151 [Cyphellophora europaea CBS 101466]
MSISLNDKILNTIRPNEWRYALLGNENSYDGQPTASKRRRMAKIAALFIPFWLLLLYLNFHRPKVSSNVLSTSSPGALVSSTFLHFLIPASSGSVPFCRTLFSAGALNYPTPRIINWDKKFDDPNKRDGGYHLAKINGVLDFLKKLGGGSDHELALIVDGQDTWFQLRPEVLLERYHAINQQARKRVWPRYGLKYEQHVIFSAQKNCDGNPTKWSCTAVPPSILPADIYGPGTDMPGDNLMNPWQNYRPRFLNTASIIGPVGALKPLFEYAKWKIDNGNFSDDQEIFCEIFGEQEFRREMVLANSDRSPDDKNDPRNGISNGTMIDLACDECQFGIGLDYRNELTMPTIYAEPSLEYTKFEGRNQKLDPIIKRSTPPYWTPDYSGETRLPEKSWSEVALHTNYHTGVTPAATHHQPGTNVSSSDWIRQWYQPHLRALVSGHAKSFRIPFAVIAVNGKTQEYWGPNDGYGGVRLHDTNGMPGHWRQWDELCGGEEVGQQVFADGKGRYRCPVYFLYWNAEHAQHQLDTYDEMKAEEQRQEEVELRAGFIPPT